MARSTFKTLFYINRSKEKKDGKCPIVGRITIDGEQVQYSTGKEVAPEHRDSRKGRCKGTGEETKEINRYLQTKEEQAKGKYQKLIWQRGYITAELLKREFMEEDKPKGFLMGEARLFVEEKRLCVVGGRLPNLLLPTIFMPHSSLNPICFGKIVFTRNRIAVHWDKPCERCLQYNGIHKKRLPPIGQPKIFLYKSSPFASFSLFS